MKRGIITISETGAVIMPTAPVWMTQFEIADLFGVFSCDEAARVVKSMPKWKPATVKDKAVRRRYTVPVTFKLQ